MALINVKVVRITEEADGVRSFLLARTGLFRMPKYTPGAHIDVHCGEGIIRQYSLCGDPNDRRHLMIAVRQVEQSRGGSDLMHLDVKEGDRLEIGSPRNNFPLAEDFDHGVLLAAGIGITPIIAMADHLHSLGKQFELHYFSRSPDHTTFRDRLGKGAYSKCVSFHEHLSPTQTGERLRDILGTPRAGGQIYMCGPAPFMDAAERIASENWPSNSINLERFAANPALAGEPTAPFSIELARSGLTLKVEADETILAVLDAHGMDAAFSCKQGVCGTCVTDIIEGVPDHRDSFLSGKQRSAGRQMCICVSRAKGDKIVLDL